MFAIVRIQGKQYKVQKGDHVEVDRMDGEVGESVKLTDVLLVENNGETNIGAPTVKNVEVQAKIVEQFSGDKVEIRRFRSKSRHRRKVGFRAKLTKLEITAIGGAK